MGSLVGGVPTWLTTRWTLARDRSASALSLAHPSNAVRPQKPHREVPFMVFRGRRVPFLSGNQGRILSTDGCAGQGCWAKNRRSTQHLWCRWGRCAHARPVSRRSCRSSSFHAGEESGVALMPPSCSRTRQAHSSLRSFLACVTLTACGLAVSFPDRSRADRTRGPRAPRGPGLHAAVPDGRHMRRSGRQHGPQPRRAGPGHGAHQAGPRLRLPGHHPRLPLQGRQGPRQPHQGAHRQVRCPAGTQARASQFIPGSPYSFVAVLESGAMSWTGILDVVRLGPADDVTAVTASQLRAKGGRPPEHKEQAQHRRNASPLRAAGSGYPSTAMVRSASARIDRRTCTMPSTPPRARP